MGNSERRTKCLLALVTVHGQKIVDVGDSKLNESERTRAWEVETEKNQKKRKK